MAANMTDDLVFSLFFIEIENVGGTNVSISSLDSLAPLFPECHFFFKLPPRI
jgi:hypothetical protein